MSELLGGWLGMPSRHLAVLAHVHEKLTTKILFLIF